MADKGKEIGTKRQGIRSRRQIEAETGCEGQGYRIAEVHRGHGMPRCAAREGAQEPLSPRPHQKNRHVQGGGAAGRGRGRDGEGHPRQERLGGDRPGPAGRLRRQGAVRGGRGRPRRGRRREDGHQGPRSHQGGLRAASRRLLAHRRAQERRPQDPRVGQPHHHLPGREGRCGTGVPRGGRGAGADLRGPLPGARLPRTGRRPGDPRRRRDHDGDGPHAGALHHPPERGAGPGHTHQPGALRGDPAGRRFRRQGGFAHRHLRPGGGPGLENRQARADRVHPRGDHALHVQAPPHDHPVQDRGEEGRHLHGDGGHHLQRTGGVRLARSRTPPRGRRPRPRGGHAGGALRDPEREGGRVSRLHEPSLRRRHAGFRRAPVELRPRIAGGRAGGPAEDGSLRAPAEKRLQARIEDGHGPGDRPEHRASGDDGRDEAALRLGGETQTHARSQPGPKRGQADRLRHGGRVVPDEHRHVGGRLRGKPAPPGRRLGHHLPGLRRDGPGDAHGHRPDRGGSARHGAGGRPGGGARHRQRPRVGTDGRLPFRSP